MKCREMSQADNLIKLIERPLIPFSGTDVIAGREGMRRIETNTQSFVFPDFVEHSSDLFEAIPET
jgi:hypothetical protein